MTSDADVAAEQVALEQQRLDVMYARLDELRDQIADRLSQSQRPTTGTPGSLVEREAMVSMYSDRVSVLNGVDDRLCFGRLDMSGGDTRYVGRIGLLDDANNPLLMDWRADAAAAFYQATGANPMGVVRRRNIATTRRTVTGLDDDVLILDEMSENDLETVTGNDSLLTALDSARTGQMRDIVATIQSEQDQIIRSDLGGILVVEGGPGTGKTVVALHRVAYLLYASRDRIARSGALIIGPNDAFVSYIDAVLPALGETGVLLRSIGSMHSGVHATTDDSPAVAILKGDHRMAEALRHTIRSRQRVPVAPIDLQIDGTKIQLTPSDVSAAIRRARDTHKPHNEARLVFVRDILQKLAGRLARALRMNLDDDTRVDLVADLRDSKDVRREVNLCWMPLTPEQVLRQLLADPAKIAEAAPWLDFDEQSLMSRSPESEWTISDVALLDELAELLGDWDPQASARDARAAAERAAQVANARDVLASSAAGQMMTAEQLADRFSQSESLAPLAERAAADRTWAYGHVVVDEAQELSPMQWRMIMRRSPSKSMTVVGDPAQTGSPAGAGSWEDAFRPHAHDRWRRTELTINYRTPALIMASATGVLDRAGIGGPRPRSVREGRWEPQSVRLESIDELATLITAEARLLEHGTLCIIGSEKDQAVLELSADVARRSIDDPVVVSVETPLGVKGLEFDGVLLFEPSNVVEASTRPAQDLYVSMTRPTQRLTIAHVSELPQLLT